MGTALDIMSKFTKSRLSYWK